VIEYIGLLRADRVVRLRGQPRSSPRTGGAGVDWGKYGEPLSVDREDMETASPQAVDLQLPTRFHIGTPKAASSFLWYSRPAKT
jgi:hypothetical protein